MRRLCKVPEVMTTRVTLVIIASAHPINLCALRKAFDYGYS